MKIVKTVAGDLLYFDLAVWDFIFDTTGYCVSTNSDGNRFITCTKGKYSKKVLSRILMSCPINLYVDHINGNPLDNRLCNLRIVTSQQNATNSTKHKDKIEKLPKGVFKLKDKFRVKLCHNYRHIHIGVFVTIAEAETAYKKAAEKYFGQFAYHISRKETK